MSTTKARLATLEKRRAAAEPVVINVYLQGPDGMLRRTDASGHLVEELTQAEFEQLPGEKIAVKAEDSE